MPAYTNATQIIPPLFKEIVEHERKLWDALSSPIIQLSVGHMVRRKGELMRQAEKVLSWNHNKGSAQ
jgi:hypothetical protein